MKQLPLLALLLATQTGHAQPRVTKLTATGIPKSIAYAGHVVDAARWTDTQGDHLVIATETGATASKSPEAEGARDAALYASHYLLQGAAWQPTWKVTDFVKECPLDIEANFVPHSFAVTDLDRNGQAEVWLMYQTACQGGVDPNSLKIIMYEAGRKYAVRGTTHIKVSATTYDGGQFTFDEAFGKGPAAFRSYAAQLWTKYRGNAGK
ncbi:M949_RS01915 family surface polysaccharide biosynthesis protein [Hymenobacter ruricola]|uniref:Uncharacterized protein n=1 Tax=Hymenobacter ruricola TaxID=2791023 RepID=A0ABS0I4V3_9BACT|nr:hypothetical protein [Hymenobacter ruricola]MBF9221930.1 hypothetical protein [Hymenobacter ruricola]